MFRTIRRGAVVAASLVGLTGALLVAAPASAAPVPESSLSWSIEPSDGQGEPVTGTFTEPTASFQSLRDGNIHRVNVSSAGTFWSISLAPPVGEQLHPGNYPNAERAGFQTGRAPGLDVTHGSSGCNQVHGRFTIHQIGFDPAGTINMLEATFVQRCSPGEPAVSGTLKYKATPLSYRWVLTDQEPGTAESHTYRGATSTFWAQTFWSSSLRFGASGGRLNDIVEFSPPQGEQLTVGTTYRDAQPVGEQDPGRPGLSVERFRCRPTTGVFTIKELEYGADGEPVALSATFTIRCTEYPSPENPNVLKGVVHFHA
ncbi:hypothetical protein KBX06_23435 [Micromonospora sp. C31]|uniref:hypothetical protein n=1 Tax=Micromonospora sp. C31 TaxID=2824876 RepID=UPI001B360989|nr:hypothetical protein [Micromonospora sp. C31]MBQ1076087.1 hypothetical protein [Micromonospora sp. C31]